MSAGPIIIPFVLASHVKHNHIRLTLVLQGIIRGSCAAWDSVVSQVGPRTRIHTHTHTHTHIHTHTHTHTHRRTRCSTTTHVIILALSLALLWVHSVFCSGQWGVGAALSSHSHSPLRQPPIVTTICAGTVTAWHRPRVTTSTAGCFGFECSGLSVFTSVQEMSSRLHLWRTEDICYLCQGGCVFAPVPWLVVSRII